LSQRCTKPKSVVPPKAKGKRQRESVKPISGLDVDALLGQKKKVKVSADNAIPEYKQILAASEDLPEIEAATKQMGDIVRSLVTDSFGDANYSRAIESMRVMRDELIKFEEPGYYNTFIQDLKKRILSGELGGDRREMWWHIKISRLGLIDDNQSEASDITAADADEVSFVN
jgi:ATP-dependent DNA helicase 2 subunit 2